jgi:CheY-like chemotaxis protein
VTAAENADAALRKLGPRRPDLIVLDLAMADRSGCDFLAACGETAHLKGIPVLVVSAPENLQKALAVGARAVLTKPIRRHEFLEVVRQLLDELGHDRPYVLVVDDDPKAVEIVSSYFVDEPVEVGRAIGGRAALELVRERRPDLMILDLMMPDVSGLDVLSELRDRADTAELPVVILTAKELTAEERSLLARHAQAVFGKPTTARGDLLNQARRLLGENARAAGVKRASR